MSCDLVGFYLPEEILLPLQPHCMLLVFSDSSKAQMGLHIVLYYLFKLKKVPPQSLEILPTHVLVCALLLPGSLTEVKYQGFPSVQQI